MTNQRPNGREQDDLLDIAFKVFGHPVRNRLFLLIREDPGMVFGEIYEKFRPIAERVTGKNFPAASLTRMLIALREMGILRTNLPEHLLTRGRSPQYYINSDFSDAVLDAYLEALQGLRNQDD